ncbi:M20/M25/M40 family metallo-hydrolase [Deinococcus taeanensis]|uniref:M42 family metallopeptidase n=1 Tax=Deinococcus taeanensis TaxID=2737050 RepID=UPI001CDC2741|nr:M20/M25/M40 family metallo-hydrolase [Deinococcus taeanensis]UBV42460.1 M20/M25/M40 family metallo-hydrolase [Deinococcus taeanensis]
MAKKPKKADAAPAGEPAALRLDVLMHLSDLPGVPGQEDAVREYVLSQLQGLVDDVRVDALGNVIARRAPRDAGREGTERVMISAHMDEIGFLVRFIDDRGFLRVQALGGFDTRNLFARGVMVHTRGGPLPGILTPGGKPVHIASAEERKKIPEVKEFFIDLGLGADEVRAQVRVGDMVTLDQQARRVGNLICGKAMDDRASVFLLLETLRALRHEAPRHEVIAVFSTQEEVGLRGAITAAYGVQPTVGIGLDVTLAVDTPGVGPDEVVTNAGQGMGIKVFDSTMISHRALVDQFWDLAQARGIPAQLEVLALGGTDGAAIQRSREGVPTLTLSLPTRYIHTVVEAVHVNDLRAGVDLLLAYLR